MRKFLIFPIIIMTMFGVNIASAISPTAIIKMATFCEEHGGEWIDDLCVTDMSRRECIVWHGTALFFTGVDMQVAWGNENNPEWGDEDSLENNHCTLTL